MVLPDGVDAVRQMVEPIVSVAVGARAKRHGPLEPDIDRRQRQFLALANAVVVDIDIDAASDGVGGAGADNRHGNICRGIRPTAVGECVPEMVSRCLAAGE